MRCDTSRRGHPWNWVGTQLMGFIFSCSCLASEPLVITSEDLLPEVGTKSVYAYSAADGTNRGEGAMVVIDRLQIADAVLAKVANFQNEKRFCDLEVIAQPDRVVTYGVLGRGVPVQEFPVPLTVGETFKMDVVGEPRAFHVRRIEQLSVPAGQYKCLVCVVEGRDSTPISTYWLAPHVGLVQMKNHSPAREVKVVLMAFQKPRKPVTLPNEIVLCSFDSGEPLNSPLCSNLGWHTDAYQANENSISCVQVDPTQSALGTCMSMRWCYHLRKAGTQLNLPLTDSSGKGTDLTRFDSLSFYIKGLNPGSCLFTIHGRPKREGVPAWVNTPVDYSSEWSKVTVDLRVAAFSAIDLEQARLIGFYHQGEDANVVWIDEMRCQMLSGSGRPAESAERD